MRLASFSPCEHPDENWGASFFALTGAKPSFLPVQRSLGASTQERTRQGVLALPPHSRRRSLQASRSAAMHRVVCLQRPANPHALCYYFNAPNGERFFYIFTPTFFHPVCPAAGRQFFA